MKATDSYLALRYHAFGKAEDVLKLESLKRETLGAKEVRIRLLAATVNPSDQGMIGGSYGRLLELPAVGGREGIGEIIELGADVENLRLGDRCCMPEAMGTWRQEVVADASDLQHVPTSLPVEQTAMAFLNPPTAVRLLTDFENLKPGDWVIQNAANSAVGFCVAQYCRFKGYKTINVVRDSKWEEPLMKGGADVVVTEDSNYSKTLKTLTDGVLPRLGLNSVGGESVNQLIKSMGEGGTVVTFGGMVGDKIRFPTRYLIFNDIKLRGYWMDKWNRTHTAAELEALHNEVFELIEKNVFKMPIDSTYTFENAIEGVKRGFAPGRQGKVILTNG